MAHSDPSYTVTFHVMVKYDPDSGAVGMYNQSNEGVLTLSWRTLRHEIACRGHYEVLAG